MEPIKNKITANELKHSLKASGIIHAVNCEVVNEFDLTSRDKFNCSAIIFEDCSFTDVAFGDCEIEFGLKFINCSFQGKFLLNNTKIIKYDGDFNDRNYSIEFIGVNFKGRFQIRNIIFNRGILFEKCVFEHFIFSNNKLLHGNVFISDSSIIGITNFANNSLKDFRFESSSMEGQVRLSANICSSICFMQSTFKRDIFLWGGNTESITFNGGVFDDSLVIQAVKSSGTLSLIGSDFKAEVEILYADNASKVFGGCDIIYIAACSFGNKIAIAGSNSVDTFHSLKSVEIKASEKLKGEINFRNFNFDTATLVGNNINAKIKFNHIHFKVLRIDEFTNASKLQFYDIKAIKHELSTLEINKSNLGLTEFYDFDFRSFNKVVIKTSILSEIIASNVTWFRKEQLYPELGISKYEAEIQWKNNREVNRQLKYAMEKQGNKIQSLEFKSYEMECYKKELIQQGTNEGNFGNKFILWLSQSNDFGLNYIKPFGLIIITALICYVFIVIGISPNLEFKLGDGCEDIKMTIYQLSKYSYGLPKMFNPLYDFNKAFKISNESDNFSFWVSFIDLVYRLVLSYLIFQLVSAFRKFVK